MQDLTVSENIYIGREPMRGFVINKAEQDKRTEALLQSLHLNDIQPSTKVRTLTVAKQQMVEIAKALSFESTRILIMDEPFGQLDAQTRYLMQQEVLRIWEEEKRTVIFVTNNIEEACYLGDRIILLSSCPATVKEVFDMSALPKPRDIVSREFLEIRSKISDQTDLSM